MGVLRGESVGIADGSFNMRRFERLSAAMRRHSRVPSVRRSDVGSSRQTAIGLRKMNDTYRT